MACTLTRDPLRGVTRRSGVISKRDRSASDGSKWPNSFAQMRKPLEGFSRTAAKRRGAIAAATRSTRQMNQSSPSCIQIQMAVTLYSAANAQHRCILCVRESVVMPYPAMHSCYALVGNLSIQVCRLRGRVLAGAREGAYYGVRRPGGSSFGVVFERVRVAEVQGGVCS